MFLNGDITTAKEVKANMSEPT